jgi:hypothetical protein
METKITDMLKIIPMGITGEDRLTDAFQRTLAKLDAGENAELSSELASIAEGRGIANVIAYATARPAPVPVVGVIEIASECLSDDVKLDQAIARQLAKLVVDGRSVVAQAFGETVEMMADRWLHDQKEASAPVKAISATIFG